MRYVPGDDPAALARAVIELAADPAATWPWALEAQRQATAYDWEHQKARYLEVVDRLVQFR